MISNGEKSEEANARKDDDDDEEEEKGTKPRLLEALPRTGRRQLESKGTGAIPKLSSLASFRDEDE